MTCIFKDQMRLWADTNACRRIIIDEIQIVPEEASFRTCVHFLDTLKELDLPIMLLSGSLPNSLLNSMINFFGIKNY